MTTIIVDSILDSYATYILLSGLSHFSMLHSHNFQEGKVFIYPSIYLSVSHLCLSFLGPA